MHTSCLPGSRAAVALIATFLYVAVIAFIRSLGLDESITGPFADTLGIGNGGLVVAWAIGHCDGMDGPVVTTAKKALETGNVGLVLPWVRAQDEPEIRKTFDAAVAVRKLGAQARDLAELHFFETLVRVHRAGEGEPFTGLKPAGRDLGPAIPAADRALEDGSVEATVKLVTDAVAKGIRERFHAAESKRRFAAGDVEAGRAYVAAYVPYIHFVERLFELANEAPHAHGHAHAPEHEAEHAH